MSTVPPWLVRLAWVSLALAVACAAVIVADLAAGHRQKMWIMNVVWPVTALYSGPLGLLAYYRIGRRSTKVAAAGGDEPFPQSVAVAATHCGAGCTLGDLVAEWGVFLVPALGTFLFHTKMFNAWVVAFVAAYLFGIVFQYFTIAPMRGLSFGPCVWAAVKADTFSLVAWQVGMYGWMAVAVFLIFGHELPKTGPTFWFMMQIAMLCGFLTSYPVNWWLVRAGVKEKM